MGASRIGLRSLGGVRVAGLLGQALGIASIGAATAGYASLDPASEPSALSPLAFFAVGSALNLFIAAALLLRFPLDALLRVPAFGVAVLLLYRSASALTSIPGVIETGAAQLILSYVGLPLALLTGALALGSDFARDILHLRRRAAHAA